MYGFIGLFPLSIYHLQIILMRIVRNQGAQMHIANPIYDVVFKYLLDDPEVAKLLISSIIGETIESLEYFPTEYNIPDSHPNFTVFFMDFSATILTKKGERKRVIIELQKAKLPTDIMRFRRYLGSQYSDKKNIWKDENGQEHPLPILSIYFLGHALRHINEPIIEVKRSYWNRVDHCEIEQRSEFIECLTHDSIIIQIPHLRPQENSRLLSLLRVFDQSRVKHHDSHVLVINEDEYPVEYTSVMRRLRRAMENDQVRQNMDVEDDYIDKFQAMERLVSDKAKEVEEKTKEVEEKTKEVEEKTKEVEEKTKEVEEKTKEVEEKTKELVKKDQVIQDQEKLIELLKKQLEQ